jgi:hypothetical protein
MLPPATYRNCAGRVPATIFATQLVSTGWYEPAPGHGPEMVLGPKILTTQHEPERAGMAEIELQNRCSTAELTRLALTDQSFGDAPL